MNAANKLLKYLLIAVVIGAIVIIILISTGIVTWEDLVKMHFKLIEICPFCM
jgi:hypothetical protein